MTAYYNEFDKFAAEWLRQLIKAGHIAPGIVDERSIEDVTPGDLAGFTQCHFFAGIGVWSYALRRAGWPDSRRVWTASCPCQPFSAAGQGVGFADERHLWPAFYHLTSQCRPDAIYGEQVASKDAGPWIDLVHTDMEALGYAFGAVPFPSAGIGAPHIRDRLYWVADADNAGLEGCHRSIADQSRRQEATRHFGSCRSVGGVEYPRHNHDAGQGGAANTWDAQTDRPADKPCGSSVSFGGMADAEHDGCGGQADHQAEPNSNRQDIGLSDRGHSVSEGQPTAGPTNGHWRDADWLHCCDGKWRPVEPGTFPLANGAAARVGRLRGYGNAINAVQAQIFIEATLTGPSI